MERKVLYIHGYASAGSNGAAVQMRDHLYPKGVAVLSPDLPLSPPEAMAMLRQMVEDEQPQLIVAVSMGALYAEQLRGVTRVLVNPSFHMARLLTFKGMGKQEFRNKRQDGATQFRVDKQMIEGFRQVEADSFKGIDEGEKARVYGLFGLQDKNVNCQPDFGKHYGRAHLVTFEGGHQLAGRVLNHTVMPLVDQLLGLK